MVDLLTRELRAAVNNEVIPVERTARRRPRR